jgi:hypothetical protein
MPDVMPYYGAEGMVQMLVDWVECVGRWRGICEDPPGFRHSSR